MSVRTVLSFYEELPVDPKTGLRVLSYEVDLYDDWFPALPEGWGCLRGSQKCTGASEYDRNSMCYTALVGPMDRLRFVVGRRLRLQAFETWGVSPLYVEILPCAIDEGIIHTQPEREAA